MLRSPYKNEFLPIFAIVLILNAFSCSNDVTPYQETSKDLFKRIVNGTPTDYKTWKGVLLVQTSYTRCTGTLINPMAVLTAAHCIVRSESSAGPGYDMSNTPSQIYIMGGIEGDIPVSGVQTVWIHPQWSGKTAMDAPDLAILQLSTAVSNLEAYRLRDFPNPTIGEPGIIVGYGIDPNNLESSGIAHRVGETAVLTVTRNILEIGGASNTCTGDSGGPLFTYQNEEWVLSGVTSFGPSECPADRDGYSVNLLGHCDWLNRTIQLITGEDLGLNYCTECSSQPFNGTWGGPCGPGYPCCPDGTKCRLPSDFSRNNLGYCAPECCNVGEEDSSYCPNLPNGEAYCRFEDEKGNAYCAVRCTDNSECPTGTTCKNKPFESEKICIASVMGDDISCDMTEPEDTDTNTDINDDLDSEPESDTDTDTLAQSDSDSEHDSDIVYGNSGCNCVTVTISNQNLLDLRALFF